MFKSTRFRLPHVKRNSLPRFADLAKVIYLDKRIVVVDKGPGLVAQFGLTKLLKRGYEEDELSVRLAEFARNESAGQEPPSDILYPTHRLDKDTSGCLALARSQDMARELSRQFQQRKIEKTYYALVRGGEQSFSEQKGTIHRPIEVSEKGWASVVETGSGKEASTSWELLGSSKKLPLSLLRLRMHTGYKHQLRLHLAKVLQAPILGDSLHSMSKPTAEIQNLLQSLAIPEDRLFLHASRLGIQRYTKRRKQIMLDVQTPLPHDLIQICQHVGIHIDPEIASAQVFVDRVPILDNLVPELDGRLYV